MSNPVVFMLALNVNTLLVLKPPKHGHICTHKNEGAQICAHYSLDNTIVVKMVENELRRPNTESHTVKNTQSTLQ